MGDLGLVETILPHLALMMATDNTPSSSFSTWCQQRRPRSPETASKREATCHPRGQSAAEPSGAQKAAG